MGTESNLLALIDLEDEGIMALQNIPEKLNVQLHSSFPDFYLNWHLKAGSTLLIIFSYINHRVELTHKS
jgi:hypothetical protein